MKKIQGQHRLKWQISFGVLLVVLSTALYLAHYLIFRDLHYLESNTLAEIAFIPIQVILVTLILTQILNFREKRAMREKMNMVIGVFFSETGTALVSRLSNLCPDIGGFAKEFRAAKDWNRARFSEERRKLSARALRIELKHEDLEALQTYFPAKRDFLLRLLENPNLLEHETFTELLWAVFHLAEELAHRKNFRHLNRADQEHLSGDIERAYRALLLEWLSYLGHLKYAYPYLFSLAVRLDPFNPAAKAEIQDDRE